MSDVAGVRTGDGLMIRVLQDKTSDITYTMLLKEAKRRKKDGEDYIDVMDSRS